MYICLLFTSTCLLLLCHVLCVIVASVASPVAIVSFFHNTCSACCIYQRLFRRLLAKENFRFAIVSSLSYSLYQLNYPPSPVVHPIMCIQIIERFAVCRCIYYSHAVDPCPKYGSHNHGVQHKEVLVGYCCKDHSSSISQPKQYESTFPDSGYSSGGNTQQYSGGSYR